jgi:hypothetical protein
MWQTGHVARTEEYEKHVHDSDLKPHGKNPIVGQRCRMGDLRAMRM